MLELQSISKSFNNVEVLHNVSFNIKQGNVLALVGENGAGKSTLMKILSGVYTDYSGCMSTDGRELRFKNVHDAREAGISIIHQELNLIPDLSIGENIFLGREPLRNGLIDFTLLHKRAEEILSEFDFPYSSKVTVRTISVGWQQIVEIARTLSLDARIIVMDEPTSALSESEIQILFSKIRYLKKMNRTVIFISHRIGEILEIADEVAVLRDGAFMGKYPAENMTQEELIRLMIGKDTSPAKQKTIPADGAPILLVKDLAVGTQPAPVLNSVNFELRKGEVLGIAGLLGSGRTVLLKFLFGALDLDFTGSIQFFGKPYRPVSPSRSIAEKIFYLPEDRKTEGLFPDFDIKQNAGISVLPALRKHGMVSAVMEREKVTETGRELQIKMDSLEQNIRTLSGGNQQKVLFTRGLMINPLLLLLDEPTRGIDIGAKEEIYRLIGTLSGKGVSVMVTSSEIPELLRVCSRIVTLAEGRQTSLLEVSGTDSREVLKYVFSDN